MIKTARLSLTTEIGEFSAMFPVQSRGALVNSINLTAVGLRRIMIIKEIRKFTGVGLKEAKEMSESLPRTFEQRDLPLGNSVTMFAEALVEQGATVDAFSSPTPEAILAADILAAFSRAITS